MKNLEIELLDFIEENGDQQEIKSFAKQAKSGLLALKTRVPINKLKIDEFTKELIDENLKKFKGKSPETLARYRSALLRLIVAFNESKLKPKSKSIPPRVKSVPKTAKGMRLSKLRSTGVGYLAWEKWQNFAREEFDTINKWRSTPSPDYASPTRKIGTATYKLQKTALSSFYGFALSEGIDKSKLSVTLLMNHGLLGKYYKYCESRGTRGLFDSFSRAFLPYLDRNTGFIPQLKEICDEDLYNTYLNMTECKNEAEFIKKGEKTFNFLNSLKIQINNGSAARQVDHHERVRPILEMTDKPLDVILEMVDRMYDSINFDDPTIDDVEIAQVTAYFFLSSVIPLRLNNVIEMKNKRTLDSVSLYKENGIWNLYVPKEKLKNKNRDLPFKFNREDNKYFDGWVTMRKLVERNKYIDVDADRQSNFFLTTSGKDGTFERSILTLSSRFLAGHKPYENGLVPFGVNPHAMRHIVATQVAKHQGIERAAAVLMDTIATVAKHYAHLKQEDMILDHYSTNIRKKTTAKAN